MTLARNHITSFPTNMSEKKFSSRFYVSITAAKAVSRENNHYLALLLCEHGNRTKLDGCLRRGHIGQYLCFRYFPFWALSASLTSKLNSSTTSPIHKSYVSTVFEGGTLGKSGL